MPLWQIDPGERHSVRLALRQALRELIENDAHLIRYRVGERAITHRLAVYLEPHFPEHNVDCEYNRDSTRGIYAPKELTLPDGRCKSTYPDIIVHRRGVHDGNLLVIEAKKRLNRNVDRAPGEDDDLKLRAFTSEEHDNRFHFKYGAFLSLGYPANPQSDEALLCSTRWYVEGQAMEGDLV